MVCDIFPHHYPPPLPPPIIGSFEVSTMSKSMSKRERLAELKALRASGKKAFDTYQVAQDQDLYEEVDENQYKKIVRERLNQDDFVVDDNGEGYADDGREEWDRVHNYGDSESEEDEMLLRGKDRGKSGMIIIVTYNLLTAT